MTKQIKNDDEYRIFREILKKGCIRYSKIEKLLGKESSGSFLIDFGFAVYLEREYSDDAHAGLVSGTKFKDSVSMYDQSAVRSLLRQYRHEQHRFWIPVFISIVALIISAIALFKP